MVKKTQGNVSILENELAFASAVKMKDVGEVTHVDLQKILSMALFKDILRAFQSPFILSSLETKDQQEQRFILEFKAQFKKNQTEAFLKAAEVFFEKMLKTDATEFERFFKLVAEFVEKMLKSAQEDLDKNKLLLKDWQTMPIAQLCAILNDIFNKFVDRIKDEKTGAESNVAYEFIENLNEPNKFNIRATVTPVELAVGGHAVVHHEFEAERIKGELVVKQKSNSLEEIGNLLRRMDDPGKAINFEHLQLLAKHLPGPLATQSVQHPHVSAAPALDTEHLKGQLETHEGRSAIREGLLSVFRQIHNVANSLVERFQELGVNARKHEQFDASVILKAYGKADNYDISSGSVRRPSPGSFSDSVSSRIHPPGFGKSNTNEGTDDPPAC